MFPACRPVRRPGPTVAYVQPLGAEYLTPSAWPYDERPFFLASNNPVAIADFISSLYCRGVRHFVLNIVSSLLGPLLPTILASPLATFVNTYSSAEVLRAIAPPNCLFCVTSNTSYLPLAFTIAKAGETPVGPLITAVGGAGVYIAGVEVFSNALNIPTYRLPEDAAAFAQALPLSSALAMAIGSDLDISQLNSLLQAYTGRVYVMDIPLAYSTSYFLMSCGCSLVLDATDEPLSLRSSLTNTILPNNSAAVALVRTPQDWNRLRKNFLATGSTEFGVTIEKAKASQRTR